FLLRLPATSDLYSLPLHDALPISQVLVQRVGHHALQLGLGNLQAEGLAAAVHAQCGLAGEDLLARIVGIGGVDQTHADRVVRTPDRKSTRLNSSHVKNSYAVFCLK